MPRNTHRQHLTEGKIIQKQIKHAKKQSALQDKQSANKHIQDAAYKLPQYKRVNKESADELYNDNVDDFMEQKTFVSFDNDNTEADVFAADDTMQHTSDFIDLSEAEYNSEEYESGEEEYDDTNNVDTNTNHTTNTTAKRSDDDSDDEIADWGHGRNMSKLSDAYYGTDTQEYELFETEEDQELIAAEQEEALKLQRNLLQQISTTTVDDELTLLDMISGTSTKHSSNNELDSIDDEGEIGDIDVIDERTKQYTVPSKRYTLAELCAGNKDVALLVNTLKHRSEQLEQLQASTIYQLIQQNAAKHIDIKIITYINTQYELLLQYCTTATYCCTLYMENKYTDTHPVNEQLDQLVQSLDAIDELDSTMQQQIEHTLNAPVRNVQSTVNKLHSITKPAQSHKSIRRDSATYSKPANFIRRQIIVPDLPVLQKPNKKHTVTDNEVIIDPTILAKKQKRINDEQALKQLHKKQRTDDKIKLNTADISDSELADAYNQYESIKQQNQQKRATKAATVQPVQGTTKQWVDLDLIAADERRAATYTILKNKGLTRYRSKTSRNPRLKSRVRYEKGLARHHSRVQQYTGKQLLNYSGEHTGIKRNTVKSVKL